MLSVILVAAAAIALPPLVPGGCTAPAADHRDEIGCYLLGEMTADHVPSKLYWHIVEFPKLNDAQTEAIKHRWSKAVLAHGRIWLFVMGRREEKISSGRPLKIIGPMLAPAGDTVSIRFLVSNFPPGMRTRVHSHPGSEAFYVVDGEQCVETPAEHHRIEAGDSYIVQGGLHMQAAAKGRKSLVALVLRPGEMWSQPEPAWKPTDFCDR